MEFKNVSKEIADVAQDYQFTQSPPLIDELMEYAGSLLRAAWEWLRGLFSQSGGSLDSRGVSHVLQIFLYVLAFGALVWLVYYVLKRTRTQEGDAAEQMKAAVRVDELLDARGWSERAAVLAAEGKYKDACRALYLSLLQSFHEKNIAVFAPSKTNYEYAYALAKYPALRKGFEQLVERVEQIWFGNRIAGEEDYLQARQQLELIEEQIVQSALPSGHSGAQPT